MAEHSREGIIPVALLSGIPPALFQVLSVQVSAGGRRLDHALVEVDLGRAGRYVQNLDLAGLIVDNGQQQINLVGAEMAIVAVIDSLPKTLHWGRVSVYDVKIPDKLVLNCRLENTHFGQPLGFQKVIDPSSGEFTRVDEDVVFNPQVKGQILGNKRLGTGTQSDEPLFMPPESVETIAAATFQQVAYIDPNDILRVSEIANDNWTLVDAVYYVLRDCNPSQTYVQNPTLQQLQNILPDDKSLLKNQRLRVGTYLPEALDQLLEPYGFTWRVHHDAPTSRTIRIIKNGVGRSRAIQLQAPGASFQPALSNTKRLDLQYDLSMAINQVRAVGSKTQVEATFELMPGWEAELDDTEPFFLMSGTPIWQQNPQYHRVWRDWVLNEDGSYTRGWRDIPPNAANPILTELFRAVFGISHPAVFPRRRRFLPMLTRGDDGNPIGKVGGCIVEWWNVEKEGGAGWEPINPAFAFFQCRLLEHEAGVTFTGPQPPDIMRWGGDDQARLRIVATIESDSRIFKVAPRPATSVNPQVHEWVADVGDRFHARLLHGSSPYHSEVVGGQRQADQADGRNALQSFATSLRTSFDQAGCAGFAQQEGLQGDYLVGDLVVGMQGREISFGLTNDPSGETGRYLQIVGVHYDVQTQTQTLVLNDYRGATEHVGSLLRKTKRLK